MKSKFDQLHPSTKAKVTQVRQLIENLPGPGLLYVFDEILTGCLRKLSSENKLAEDLAGFLNASGALVLLLNDGRYRLESGYVKEAPAAIVETLYAVGEAIKAVVSPRPIDQSGSIH